jgi:plastocyanin
VCCPTKETIAMTFIRRLGAVLPACTLAAAAALAVALPPSNDATGTISGVVRFTGTVPPPKKVTTTEGGTLLHSDLMVDPKTRGLRDVAAVLEDAPAQPKADKAEAAVIDQRDMVFIPRVVVVRHGQAVRFDNSDRFNHSVMTTSTVRANQMNVFVQPGKPLEHVFQVQKHPVQVGCSLHAWMRAWVFVQPHPWAAVSDEQGRFVIEEVPPGRYTLWLRHPDTGLQERKAVEVKPGETARVEFEWKKAGE